MILRINEKQLFGYNDFESGIPESFNVLTKEMRSLALDVELNQNETK